MLTIGLISALVAVPFVDGDGRFTLDLPGCWRPGPLAADQGGASFQYTVGGELALAAVRLLPEASSPKPAQALRAWSAGLTKLPGFVLVEEGSVLLGGLPGARRRYALPVDGQSGVSKLAEDRAVILRGVLYVVHVEALQEKFAAMKQDFEHLFAHFRAGSERAAPAQPPLAGEWLMRGTTDGQLSLRPDGTFSFAGVAGSYRVRGRQLWLCNENGEDERFSFHQQEAELVLNQEGWDEPVRYQRAPSEPLAPLPSKNPQP